MLRRKITDELIKWKNDPDKMCLLVKGARQVGKTYSISDFGKKNYKNYIYINFETSAEKRRIFDGDLSIESLTRKLSVEFPRINLEPGRTLIFLDEIQNCPNARVAFKTFSMDKSFDVIGSGSLLGVNYKEVSSYPVGYEKSIEMYSLDFEEFLWALGYKDDLIEHLGKCISDKMPIEDSILDRVNECFRWYIIVGGMPNVVNSYLKTNDFGKVLSMQRDIVSNYMDDITKYAPESDKTKARRCFMSIPVQLGKKNKKFQFSDIEQKKGVGSREYDNSLMWLYDAGIINHCYNLREPALPIASNVRLNSYKIYLRDTGLLISMFEDGIGASILDDDIGINEGAIMENAVSDVLGKQGIMLTYFEKKGGLEVDFVLNIKGKVAALKVKSGNNRQSKSLDALMHGKYNVERGIKLERSNVSVGEDGIEHYPLFTASFVRFL